MVFFKKKEDEKKKKDSFEEYDPFTEMRKMMDNMMKSFSGFDESSFDEEMFKKVKPGKPMVYGFSVKMGPGGKMRVDDFGNVQTVGRKPSIKKEREPLVDVMNKEKTITVLAELPGVNKKDIHVHTEDDGMSLIIDVPQKFYKEVKLPEKVKPSVSKAHYKNGVLEVDLEKVKPTKKKKKETEILVE